MEAAALLRKQEEKLTGWRKAEEEFQSSETRRYELEVLTRKQAERIRELEMHPNTKVAELEAIDRQPPWKLTPEWIEERLRLTKEYLASFKDGYSPNRAPTVSLPGNQLICVLKTLSASQARVRELQEQIEELGCDIVGAEVQLSAAQERVRELEEESARADLAMLSMFQARVRELTNERERLREALERAAELLAKMDREAAGEWPLYDGRLVAEWLEEFRKAME
jgi:hypothetical protein